MKKWSEVEERLEDLPVLAQQIAIYGGVFTGGVVSYLIGDSETFNDIDIVIPVHAWRTVGKLINNATKIVSLNKFGGLRLNIAGIKFDIWPADIHEYLCDTGKAGKPFWILDIHSKRLIESKGFEE